PIVPSDKDQRGRPELALAQLVDAIGGPLAPLFDCLLPSVLPVTRMFGKLHPTAWRVHPGHIRQFPRRHVCIESSPRQNIWAVFQLCDLSEITESGVAVGGPCKFRLL